MKFKMLFIKKTEEETYIVSKIQKPEFEIYFTTDEGFLEINPHLDEMVTFKELPTPLLKQIK